MIVHHEDYVPPVKLGPGGDYTRDWTPRTSYVPGRIGLAIVILAAIVVAVAIALS